MRKGKEMKGKVKVRKGKVKGKARKEGKDLHNHEVFRFVP